MRPRKAGRRPDCAESPIRSSRAPDSRRRRRRPEARRTPSSTPSRRPAIAQPPCLREPGCDRERQDHVTDAGSIVVVTPKPESRNTSSIRRLPPSTYGVERVMPCSRARLARCSSRRVPMPWPCTASETAKATSARSSESGSRWKPAKATMPPSGFGDQRGRRTIGAGLRSAGHASALRAGKPRKRKYRLFGEKAWRNRTSASMSSFLRRPQTDGGPVADDDIGRGCIVVIDASARRDPRSTLVVAVRPNFSMR